MLVIELQRSSPMTHRLKAVLFAVDGTLVDSNDAHAEAWIKAFAAHGVGVDPAHVRRCIGMGGDKLMPAVSGIEEESPRGALIAKLRAEIFAQQFLPRLRAFTGASELVAAVKRLGLAAIAASSAKKSELKRLLEIARAAALMDGATSSDDAEESKPDPDIVEAALKRAGAHANEAVMIGDTRYDIEAARRAGVSAIAFRSGGWADQDLAGAVAIYDGAWDLLARLGESPIARLR
jgi:HAD superfamily hydrolase (TIGR01509 family)